MLISNLLPSKKVQNRNQSINTSIFTKEENKTHNSSNDNNINTNGNISYQKTLCLSNNESNYDLISQTDGSTIKNNNDLKVNVDTSRKPDSNIEFRNVENQGSLRNINNIPVLNNNINYNYN